MPLTSILFLIDTIQREKFKQKTFSQFLSTFLKPNLNFEDFQKILIADLFLRLRPQKNVVTSMAKKFRFRLAFKNKHGKRVPTLLKSERHHLYHIY